MSKDLLLREVKAWEELFFGLYKRKPKMIEREQFFLGLLAQMRIVLGVENK